MCSKYFLLAARHLTSLSAESVSMSMYDVAISRIYRDYKRSRPRWGACSSRAVPPPLPPCLSGKHRRRGCTTTAFVGS